MVVEEMDIVASQPKPWTRDAPLPDNYLLNYLLNYVLIIRTINFQTI